MMVEAPEKIWAASVTENYGEWQTTTDGMPRPTEYTRSDLVAELAAEIERLKREAAEWEVIARAKSEEAVTERALKRAIVAYRDTPEYDHHLALRNAIKAAMEIRCDDHSST